MSEDENQSEEMSVSQTVSLIASNPEVEEDKPRDHPFTEKDRTLLFTNANLKTFRKEKVIISPQMKNKRTVHVIKKGRVELFIFYGSPLERRIGYYNAGDVFSIGNFFESILLIALFVD